MELIKEIGAYAGLVAFFGLAVLALLSFAQGRDVRRLREWAGSAPERDAERKESTSAAAAERAEEMRKLEEARDAERDAAQQREQRRERREAGLPEEGWRGRLGDPRYLVGIFAVLILLVGGVAYAVTQGGGEDGKAGGKSAKRRTQAALQPSEIEVTVLNGTAVDGLAGTYGNKVEQHGFQLGAVGNSQASFSESVVMFEQGEGRAAHRVADVLEISRVRPITPEIASLAAGASVAVVVGEDNASATG